MHEDGPESEPPIRLLALGGSTRENSSSEIALRIAADSASQAGAEVEFLVGRDLMLPIYDAEDSFRSASSTRLVEAYARADGIIIASPGYHGSMSGMIKNALDYAEDLRRIGRSYFDGLAVGCISVAYGWQASVSALQHLRGVAHALRAWPTPLGVALNTSVNSMETIAQDPTNHHAIQLTTVASQVVRFTQAMRAEQMAKFAPSTSMVRPVHRA
ncbi:FMN reductase [Georgenia ruanii]|uniref:FMN reductase n=1 Tax=Georgenia ruanii TaxID=348442 RepID=A0A7J9USN5_9MICO|nr:FMN reductase [Georgenia ruanii]